MPIAMSVNMFRLRWTIDDQPRSKNGQPPHKYHGRCEGEFKPSETSAADEIVQGMARASYRRS